MQEKCVDILGGKTSMVSYSAEQQRHLQWIIICLTQRRYKKESNRLAYQTQDCGSGIRVSFSVSDKVFQSCATAASASVSRNGEGHKVGVNKNRSQLKGLTKVDTNPC